MNFCRVSLSYRVSPSHRLTAPKWFPSHGVQSFRNRLLHCGACVGRGPVSKPAPERAPLSLGPQVLPGADCSSVGFLQAPSLLRAPSALVWGPARAAGGSLLPMDLHGLQGHSCHTTGCTRQGTLLLHMELLLRLLLHQP